MASRRKRALPPWLQGVTVKKGEKKTAPLSTDDESLIKQDEDTPREAGLNSLLGLDSKGKEDKGESQLISQENSLKAKNSKTGGVTVGEASKLDGNNSDEMWSVEKAVEMSYKEFVFKGSIIYSHNMDDCNLLCDDIISSIDANSDTIIGFDTEWPVTYEKGRQAKTSLVQLCLCTSKCYLFHLSCMPRFPVMLRKLIECHQIKKVGLNIENDFWKLGTDFDLSAKDIIQNSTIELKTLGNKKLRSAENWSLEGLAKNVLQVRISKDPAVRKYDWRQFPLPEAQQRYAATDAVVSLMIYQKLISK